jgi:hypothetical protein
MPQEDMLPDDQLQFNSDGEDDDLEHDPSINRNRVWIFVRLIDALPGSFTACIIVAHLFFSFSRAPKLP